MAITIKEIQVSTKVTQQKKEPDRLRRLADTEHGDSFPCDEGFLPQVLDGVGTSVMLSDHTEAGRATVHTI